MDVIEVVKSQVDTFFEMPIFAWDNSDEMLRQFEGDHCQFPNQQVCFKQESLKNLFIQGGDFIIYHMLDDLGIGFAAFKFEGTWFVAGPFSTSLYSDDKALLLVDDAKLSADLLTDYKLYYCSYRVVDLTIFSQLINSIALSIAKIKARFTLTTISSNYRTSALPDYLKETDTHIDYATIGRRYAAENKFIESLQIGDTESALKNLARMRQMADGLAVKLQGQTGFLIGCAIIRTLVRQGVKDTGIHVVTLHMITTKYMERMHKETNFLAYEKWSREFIIDICRAVRESSQGEYSQLIRHAIGYINLNLGEQIQINDIAKEVNLSTSHLSRLFKLETGDNISNYLTKKRVEKACRLLKFTDLPIGDISCHVGYLDNSYFVKVFKKLQQASPSEYRKVYKK